MNACLIPRRQIRELTVKAVCSRQVVGTNVDKCKLLILKEIAAKKKFAADVNGRRVVRRLLRRDYYPAIASGDRTLLGLNFPLYDTYIRRWQRVQYPYIQSSAECAAAHNPYSCGMPLAIPM